MNKQKLGEISGMNLASVAKLVKRDNITTDVLIRICTTLDSDISDIMEIVNEEGKKTNNG